MRAREVADTIRVRPFVWDRTQRVLASCHTVNDVRRRAKRVLPKAVFDYLEGGSDEESTLRENLLAFRAWQFQPRSLNDVSQADPSCTLLGKDLALPLVLAPTGYTRMMHPEGESAVARAAASARVPYAISTVATTSIVDVAEAVRPSIHPDDPGLWLQLYLFRERKLSWDMLERAHAAGIRVLEFSVDTAVSGRRIRDVRNGFTIPPSLSPGALLEMGLHLRYWTSMLRAPALEFANFKGEGSETIAAITSQFDSSLTWADIQEVRSRWPGSLTIKGPLSPHDARRALDEGIDLVHLSNHGGRQLDRCVPPIDTVRDVRAAIGDAPLIVDSGVRHGMDIAVAVALGADAVAVGRPYLYGLAVAGEAGVRHVIQLLGEELLRSMQLIGVTSIAELREIGGEILRRRSV